jgi:hypothetical protein
MKHCTYVYLSPSRRKEKCVILNQLWVSENRYFYAVFFASAFSGWIFDLFKKKKYSLSWIILSLVEFHMISPSPDYGAKIMIKETIIY